MDSDYEASLDTSVGKVDIALCSNTHEILINKHYYNNIYTRDRENMTQRGYKEGIHNITIILL